MATIKKIKSFEIDYDEYADVLYISFGKPRKAISIEANEGDFIRIDPFSDKIVGITIIDFKEKYLKKGNLQESAEAIIPQILHTFEQRNKIS